MRAWSYFLVLSPTLSLWFFLAVKGSPPMDLLLIAGLQISLCSRVVESLIDLFLLQFIVSGLFMIRSISLEQYHILKQYFACLFLRELDLESIRFTLCILDAMKPDSDTMQPLDEGFGAIVQSFRKLRRLSLLGQLTNQEDCIIITKVTGEDCIIITEVLEITLPQTYSEFEARATSVERNLKYQQTRLSNLLITMFYIVNFNGASQIRALALSTNHTARMVCRDSWDFMLLSTVVAAFNIAVIGVLARKYFRVYKLYIHIWNYWKELDDYGRLMGWLDPLPIISGPVDKKQLKKDIAYFWQTSLDFSFSGFSYRIV
ncbi:hypothetical protein RJT34_09370 [Clitoria ternatea]|uniref:Uncharacterized protein n=1 Tax=Clitoria ternatea TaxID=43366 RepID=A0AAN9K854_CLITE